MLGKAERLSPRDPLLWAFRVLHALAHVLSEDYEAAVERAQKTMRIPRASIYWPHAVLGAALANLGRIEEARAAVTVALERKPDLSLVYLEKTLPTKEPGDFYVELKVVLPPADSDNAKALYEKMKDELPFDPRADSGRS